MTYSITIYYEPGTGRTKQVGPVTLWDLIDRCLRNNTPFTVGHIFGNIDGSHPKTK